jgi:endonuclease III
MSSPRFRLAPRGRQRLQLLERVLHEAYEAPEAQLGNQTNPLDEAIYIILSFQTDLARLKEAWRRLRSAFPRWEGAERAPSRAISRVLKPSGLHRQKARAIKALLARTRREFGTLSLDALRSMPDAQAEKLLVRLPGLSWKGARCVLLYSLGRNVLPVDGNTFRILARAGVLPQGAVYRRRSLHDGIQAALPPEVRRQFHINVVIHGQRTCLPERPRCEGCAALSLCLRRGLPELA